MYEAQRPRPWIVSFVTDSAHDSGWVGSHFQFGVHRLIQVNLFLGIGEQAATKSEFIVFVHRKFLWKVMAVDDDDDDVHSRCSLSVHWEAAAQFFVNELVLPVVKIDTCWNVSYRKIINKKGWRARLRRKSLFCLSKEVWSALDDWCFAVLRNSHGWRQWRNKGRYTLILFQMFLVKQQFAVDRVRSWVWIFWWEKPTKGTALCSTILTWHMFLE